MLVGHLFNPHNVPDHAIERLEPVSCIPSIGPCIYNLPDGSQVNFEIQPKDNIRPMQALKANISAKQGILPEHLTLSGRNMEMGFNRFIFQKRQGIYQANLLIPVCTLQKMDWEAAIQLQHADKKIILPFLFSVERY
jgi:hypothetical protein